MPEAGIEPLQVSFLASPSGGTGAITFAWQFGDGAVGLGSNPTHTYVAPWHVHRYRLGERQRRRERNRAKYWWSLVNRATVVCAVPLSLSFAQTGTVNVPGGDRTVWVGFDPSPTAPSPNRPCGR